MSILADITNKTKNYITEVTIAVNATLWELGRGLFELGKCTLKCDHLVSVKSEDSSVMGELIRGNYGVKVLSKLKTARGWCAAVMEGARRP